MKSYFPVIIIAAPVKSVALSEEGWGNQLVDGDCLIICVGVFSYGDVIVGFLEEAERYQI